ncbi:hypothetical protein, partial [Sphingomonas sp. LH128]|uniref:hypothetical protein n=1 Tax=Sphingomonas sp. LH128 TaxID=473781 RepID=UPI002E1474B5
RWDDGWPLQPFCNYHTTLQGTSVKFDNSTSQGIPPRRHRDYLGSIESNRIREEELKRDLPEQDHRSR